MAAVVETGVRDGVMILNKPVGWTSHDVVAKVRGVIKGAKIGHAGTLDPAATGVLPILIGKATRIAEHLVEWEKEYRAVMRLGTVTDTQDATGTVLAQKPVPSFSNEHICAVSRRFEGTITQIPPMYSAVKMGGVPLYRVAREGKTVAREPRTITIHRLEVMGMEGPDVTLHVRCSKGTYIRTLCADLGEALGCGGHLLSLQRTRVGPLALAQALSIEDVCRLWDAGTLGGRLLSLDEALAELPVVIVDEPTAARVLHGVAVPSSPAVRELSLTGQPDAVRAVRIKDEHGRLLAVGELGELAATQGQKSGWESVGIRIRKVFGGREQD